MLKKIYYSFLIFFCFLLPGFAQEQGVPVIIDGTTVMRLYDTADTPAEPLAKKVTSIIEAKINAGAPGKELVVKDSDKGKAIYWGDTLVLIITKEQAKKQNSDLVALANLWNKNIISVVGEERLWVSERSLNIAVSESGSISVGDSGEISIKYDEKVLEVSSSPSTNTISFTPLTTGDFSVNIKRGKGRSIVKIFARERAGEIRSSIEQTVTGSPADADIIRMAAIMRVWDAVTIKSGASLYFKSLPEISSNLASGDKMTVPVSIIIDGPQYYRTEGTVNVVVKNQPIKWNETSFLWVSNRPETVKEDGILFKRNLTKEISARLLYSHKNGVDAKRKLIISIKNPNKKKTSLLIRKSSAGPDKYELYAGHKAAMRYMASYLSGSGMVLELAPGASAEIEDSDIQSQFLLSGFCDFQILEGESAEIKVLSYTSNSMPDYLPEIEEPFDPFKIHPHGVFPNPDTTISRSYKLSSPEPVYVEVGKWPWLIDSETAEPNTGNYGAIHRLKITFLNDTKQRGDVRLTFIPLNGLAQGSIILDGKLMETTMVKKHEPNEIKVFSLAAGEEREIELITMPEASSSYPVKFLFDRGI